MITLTEISKQPTERQIAPENQCTLEQINTGCLQRIADAMEKMAQPYSELLEDVQILRHNNEVFEETIERLKRSIRAYKGLVKTLKYKRKEHIKDVS